MLKGLRKLHPAFRYYDLAKDAYRFWQQYHQYGVVLWAKGGFNLNGWSYYCNTGGMNFGPFRGDSAGCGVKYTHQDSQLIENGAAPVQYMVGGVLYQHIRYLGSDTLYPWLGLPGYYRGTMTVGLRRPFFVEDPITIPGDDPDIALPPAPLPEWLPAVDPFALPLLQPAPPPVPLPWRAIPRRFPNPYRAPGERTETGPQPSLDRPLPFGYPGIEYTPEQPAGRLVPPKFKPRTKPVHGQKERKLALRLGGTIPFRVMGTLTEFGDFVDALYAALPPQYQADNKLKMMAKAAWVFRNADHIDVAKAMDNLLMQEMQDRAIGFPNKQLGDSLGKNPYYGRPVGYGTGVL